MVSDVVLLKRMWPPASAPADWVSQIGGHPNLPGDWSWPSIRFGDGSRASLDFLAQIDLAELPAVSQRARLPATGTLYFFALSQSHVPLAEHGPDAARVLYFPGDARVLPRRHPPADAGWNQAEMHHMRTVAAEFRHTDAPRGELLPRCPIRPTLASVVDDTVSDGSSPPATSFKHPAGALPYRVEDALLHVNFARNAWRENIVPFAVIREHVTAGAHAYLELERNPRTPAAKANPRPRPAYVDNALSDAFWSAFEGEYLQWRQRAAALSDRLSAVGRPTVLDDAQRSAVNAILAEADALKRKIGPYGLQFKWREESAAKMSLASVLLDHPEIAATCADEVLAAHPSLSQRASHRMLGPPHDVQGDTLDGPNPVLLLQLDSDEWGPRLMWWDAGNITFWMSAADAAKRRFEKARAEIEGH
jgi:hypothetical protein